MTRSNGHPRTGQRLSDDSWPLDGPTARRKGFEPSIGSRIARIFSCLLVLLLVFCSNVQHGA